MSYVYIVLATLMFSFVGTLVKVASPMVPASAITFSRFFFGCLFLLVLCLVTRKKPRFVFRNKWIWIAVAAKCVNYFCENIALHKGVSFGNIVVYPVQAIALCFFSALLFKEKIGPRKIISTILCVSGIMIISWNGNTPDVFVGDALPLTLLFVLSAVGAAGFVLSQKILVKTVPAVDMNLSVFSIGALIALVPMGFESSGFSEFRLASFLALVGLGVITGGAFLLVSRALEKMSLVIAGMIQNGSVLLALLWASIFWREPVTLYVLLGTVVFLLGLVFINVSPQKGIFVN